MVIMVKYSVSAKVTTPSILSLSPSRSNHSSPKAKVIRPSASAARQASSRHGLAIRRRVRAGSGLDTAA
jgi:hypothetical protein